MQKQLSIATLVSLLSLLDTSTSSLTCTCKHKLQVYSQCRSPVYCKYAGPDNETKDWHRIPNDFVVDYSYPTANNISTLWCASQANVENYATFSLKVINATQAYPAVEYTFSTGGNHGTASEPPFGKTGITITPIGSSWDDLERFGCPNLECEAGDIACMQQTSRDDYHCSASVNVRLILCTSPDGEQPSQSTTLNVTASSTNPLPTFQTTRIPPPKH